jgi:hypothetical protein
VLRTARTCCARRNGKAVARLGARQLATSPATAFRLAARHSRCQRRRRFWLTSSSVGDVLHRGVEASDSRQDLSVACARREAHRHRNLREKLTLSDRAGCREVDFGTRGHEAESTLPRGRVEGTPRPNAPSWVRGRTRSRASSPAPIALAPDSRTVRCRLELPVGPRVGRDHHHR